MASIQNQATFSFGSQLGGDGGFPLFQSTAIQLNWRNNPNIGFYRQIVKDKIIMYLAERVPGDVEKIASFAAKFEHQLFTEAMSKEDYMNQHTFYSRMHRVIECEYNTKYASLVNPGSDSVRATSAACNTVPTDSQHCLSDSSLNSMAGAHMSADSQRVGILQVGRNQRLDRISPSNELLISHSAREGFSDQLVNSGQPFPGAKYEYLTGCAHPVNPGSDCFRATSVVSNLLNTDNQQYCLPGSLNSVTGAPMSGCRQGVDESRLGRKRSLDMMSPSNEQFITGVSSKREDFSNIQPVDSGPTFSGSILHYESELSDGGPIESQYLAGGECNPTLLTRANSSSIRVKSRIVENLKSGSPVVSEVFPSVISDKISGAVEVNTQLQTLEFQQLERSRSLAKVPSNLPSVEKAESCRAFVVQDVHTHSAQCNAPEVCPSSSPNGSGSCSFPCNLHEASTKDILCCSKKYMKLEPNDGETQAPFFAYLHTEKCGDGICKCEEYRSGMSDSHGCNSASCWINGLDITGNIVRESQNDHNIVPGSTRPFPVPSKFRKLNPAEDDSSPTTVPLPCLEESPILQQLSPSLESVNSEAADLKYEMITSHRSNSGGDHKNDALDAPQKTNSVVAPAVSEEPSVICKSEEMKHSSDILFTGKAIGTSCALSPDFCPVSTTEQLNKQMDVMMRKKIGEAKMKDIAGDSLLSATSFGSEMKPEKEKMIGVSLTEFFSAEEVKQHIHSLRNICDQGVAEDMLGRSSNVGSENTCHLCCLDRLVFPPMPIYCSACSIRIKNYATYYFKLDENSAHFCFCSTCYNKSRGGNITFCGLSVPKCKLEMKKNDVVTEESWVQCDQCERWQHQICALFNDKRDTGGKSEYVCPKCYVEELETGDRMPLSLDGAFGVTNLQRTKLSDHIEERLFKHLKQEKEERARAAGKNIDEVPEAADLAVRVVSSVDKQLKVKQQFLDIFSDKSYPAEFPYRSKVILLFQKIEGVDVCLFGMYVQEFGSECSRPNQRCVYVSYLDSVKYFRPDIKTVTGEALRTFVYHEILIAYLEYCKKRGFATCYIWACPPVKGEDYILYCHPETQKTPKPDKLRQWYQAMLKKACKEKIVVNYTNLYEQFFVPNGDGNTKVTAARLPYFDGDYWSGVAENMIKKIEQECGGNLQKKVKKITRRSLKAMGHINPSEEDAKDILLMKELGQNIAAAKEDFIIVYLQPVCTHCHEVILSGKKWFCKQCRNYQLCGRQYEDTGVVGTWDYTHLKYISERHDVAEQIIDGVGVYLSTLDRIWELCHDSEPGSIHTTSSGQKHALSEEVVNDVPIDTEDSDAILNNCFLENRHAFLSFCQGNHYQFDTLRRAKHSSMMILYHIHHPNVATARNLCSLCLTEIMLDPQWKCEICTGFSVCAACYQRNGAACHSHYLSRYPPGVDCSTISERSDTLRTIVRELLSVVVHASRCHLSISQCSYPNCRAIRRLFSHARLCKIRASGGCIPCKKTWVVLMMHSRKCRDTSCCVPRCRDLKEYVQSISRQSSCPLTNTVPAADMQHLATKKPQ